MCIRSFLASMPHSKHSLLKFSIFVYSSFNFTLYFKKQVRIILAFSLEISACRHGLFCQFSCCLSTKHGNPKRLVQLISRLVFLDGKIVVDKTGWRLFLDFVVSNEGFQAGCGGIPRRQEWSLFRRNAVFISWNSTPTTGPSLAHC